jgi:hypothetical protein
MEAKICYQADVPTLQMDADSEELCFSYVFDEPCIMLGSARTILFMSTSEHNDIDVHVQVCKANQHGKLLVHKSMLKEDHLLNGMIEPELIYPLVYLRPTDALRASCRAVDETLSIQYWPEHDYSRSEKLKAGEVVKLEIGNWFVADWHAF